MFSSPLQFLNGREVQIPAWREHFFGKCRVRYSNGMCAIPKRGDQSKQKNHDILSQPPVKQRERRSAKVGPALWLCGAEPQAQVASGEARPRVECGYLR